MMFSCSMPGGSDYGGSQMITVTFPAGDNSVDFTIPIVNNEIAECPENFTLQLVIPQSAADLGVVTKSDDTALISIMDDDGNEQNDTCSQLLNNKLFALQYLDKPNEESLQYHRGITDYVLMHIII